MWIVEIPKLRYMWNGERWTHQINRQTYRCMIVATEQFSRPSNSISPSPVASDALHPNLLSWTIQKSWIHGFCVPSVQCTEKCLRNEREKRLCVSSVCMWLYAMYARLKRKQNIRTSHRKVENAEWCICTPTPLNPSLFGKVDPYQMLGWQVSRIHCSDMCARFACIIMMSFSRLHAPHRQQITDVLKSYRNPPFATYVNY